MSLKKILFAACLVACSATTHVFAQSGFCTSLHALIADAGNKFTISRGNTIKASSNAVIWECKTKLPGVLSARIVSSMGIFYEGALFQTTEKDVLNEKYRQFTTELNNCLGKEGYKETKVGNFTPGLEAYKKVIYMKDDASIENPPPHVSLEVLYNKDAKNYTIILYVLEQ